MAFVLMDGRYMDGKAAIENALEAIKAIEAVKYIDRGTGGRTKYGLDGKSVADAAPSAACLDGVGMARVDMAALIPVLVAAVQELAAKVETKRTRAPKAAAAE